MKTTKQVLKSTCCCADVNYAPPCLGEEGFYVCDRCSCECIPHIEEVVTHIEIEKGVYRPVK
jgi:hypothetical protein